MDKTYTCSIRRNEKTMEVEITSPSGNTIFVPIERLQDELKWLGDRTWATLWKTTQLTCAQMRFLASVAE